MEKPQVARRAAFVNMLALTAVLGVLRLADLLFGTDPATGYVLWGAPLLRCLPPAFAVAAAWLLAGRLAPRPAALAGELHTLRLAAFVPCVLWAVGAVQGVAAGPAGQGVAGSLNSGLALLAALGLFALVRAPQRKWPAGVYAVLLLPWHLWLTIRRALLEPAASVNLSATLRVLSAVAMLMLSAALLRAVCLPGQPGSRLLFTAGFAAFLLGACMEGPQAVWEWAHGAATLETVLTGLTAAGVGLCGLAGAWYACSPPAPQGEL